MIGIKIVVESLQRTLWKTRHRQCKLFSVVSRAFLPSWLLPFLSPVAMLVLIETAAICCAQGWGLAIKMHCALIVLTLKGEEKLYKHPYCYITKEEEESVFV